MNFFTCLLVLTVIFITGCGPVSTPTNEVPVYGSIPVVATLPAVTELVKQVGGVRVKVTTLTPAGVDPAVFQPGEQDLALLKDARLFFHAGGSYEKAWVEAAKNQARLTIEIVGGSVKPEQRIQNPETGAEVEPAFWGDASLWTLCIEDVLEALTRADPASRTSFEQNAAFFREKLRVIHDWSIRRAQEITPEKRVLVVPTQTFAYFGKAYGFEVIAATDDTSASKAASVVLEKGIPAVFPVAEFSSEAIAGVATQSGIRLASPLYGYGPARKQNLKNNRGETYDEANYMGMLKHNLYEIVDGLP